MCLVVLLLDLAAPFRLLDRNTHGIRNGIRIHDHMSLAVARRPADGLDQRRLRTQEAFLVRIQDCHQGNLRYVQSLTQKVDAHQHIEHIQTQIADNLRAL